MSAAEHTVPAIEMKGITKIYSNGVVANKDVDFSVNYGEIHAVMGENGAGKSTLMKMLFGIEKVDKGQIFFGKAGNYQQPGGSHCLEDWHGSSGVYAGAIPDSGGKYGSQGGTEKGDFHRQEQGGGRNEKDLRGISPAG